MLNLLVPTVSQADLQMAFDTVHAWGVRQRFSFGAGPTKSATVTLLVRPDILAAFPCCWSSSAGIWVLFSLSLFLGALTSILSGPRGEGIVSCTSPVPGALVKVSFSPSLLPFSSPMFSRALLLVSSFWVSSWVSFWVSF